MTRKKAGKCRHEKFNSFCQNWTKFTQYFYKNVTQNLKIKTIFLLKNNYS
jgi:hypothetical protein